MRLTFLYSGGPWLNQKYGFYSQTQRFYFLGDGFEGNHYDNLLPVEFGR